MIKKDNKDIIIVILSIIVAILFVYILVDKLFLSKETNNADHFSSSTTGSSPTSSSTTSFSTTLSTTQFKDLSASELISLLKQYYKSLGKDYYDENNTIRWEISNIQYLGYYNSDKDAKYYVAKGVFTCKNDIDDCIYVEQEIEDTNNFVSAFVVKYSNSKYSISQLVQPTFEIQVKNDPNTKKDFILVDEKIK